MYLELFKLRELPFRLSPDPQFLYLSKGHARAKAYMESTIWFTDGFVVITGEIGAGKTTLIETFLKELGRDVVVAQVNQTQVSAIEFLQSVLAQFGFSPFKMKKAELLATLNNFLIEQYAAGRKVLLIIDEAQNLTERVLEEVRMLSGVETTKDKVLRIILAGQPELNQKLDAPELIQLAQRVRLRFHLSRLSPEDLVAYILHRLEVAGSRGRRIFAPETFELIFRYTGGTPRLTNTLCDTAMLAAFGREHDTVTCEDVRAAIEELQWQEFPGAAEHAAAATVAALAVPVSTPAASPATGSVDAASADAASAAEPLPPPVPAGLPAAVPAAPSGDTSSELFTLDPIPGPGGTGEQAAVTGAHAAVTGAHAAVTGSYAPAVAQPTRGAGRPAEPAAAPVDHAATTGTRAVLRARQELAAAAEAHAAPHAAPPEAAAHTEVHGESTHDHVEHSGIRPADIPPQVPDGPPLAHVLLAHGARTLFERALYPGRLLIGRTPNNDVQIDSKFISRHHCQILTTPTGCTIEDLNSRNGVFIKSKRVRLHHLNDGDVVTIGQHEILYIDERPTRRQD
ncbi:MAG: AAA family ATPase [Gammaproteobacteria bacterium]|nr:AAA family ATPase [Gammaproteobacteria bacterium]